jgi:capsid portal protein
MEKLFDFTKGVTPLEELKLRIEKDIKEVEYYKPLGSDIENETSINVMKQILSYIEEFKS